MQVTDYSLEALVKTFEDHARISEDQRKKALEEFPDAEWAKDPFSIAQALHHICSEIKSLRDRLEK